MCVVPGVDEQMNHGARRPRHREPTQFERELGEGQAALMLVSGAVATRVTLTGLRFAERLGPILLPAAQELGIPLRVDHASGDRAVLVVGPKLRDD